jgi:hypothetical protein
MIVAERIYNATVENERFKKHSGVVESFVNRQLAHVAQVQCSQKQRLSYPKIDKLRNFFYKSPQMMS